MKIAEIILMLKQMNPNSIGYVSDGNGSFREISTAVEVDALFADSTTVSHQKRIKGTLLV